MRTCGGPHVRMDRPFGKVSEDCWRTFNDEMHLPACLQGVDPNGLWDSCASVRMRIIKCETGYPTFTSGSSSGGCPTGRWAIGTLMVIDPLLEVSSLRAVRLASIEAAGSLGLIEPNGWRERRDVAMERRRPRLSVGPAPRPCSICFGPPSSVWRASLQASTEPMATPRPIFHRHSTSVETVRLTRRRST